MAEPLRRVIKASGIKRYGIIRCFDILADMFGYDDFKQLGEECDRHPPSPSDLNASPREQARRYRQYTDALKQNGLDENQAAFVLKSSPPSNWLHFPNGIPSQAHEEAAPFKACEEAPTAVIRREHVGSFQSAFANRPATSMPNHSSEVGIDAAPRHVASPHIVIWFDNDVVVKKVAKTLSKALKAYAVPSGYNRCLNYAARMFGHLDYNHLYPTFGGPDQISADD